MELVESEDRQIQMILVSVQLMHSEAMKIRKRLSSNRSSRPHPGTTETSVSQECRGSLMKRESLISFDNYLVSLAVLQHKLTLTIISDLTIIVEHTIFCHAFA